MLWTDSDIKKIAKVRHNINKGTTKTLIQTLVLLKLDYCNSLLLELNQYIITKITVSPKYGLSCDLQPQMVTIYHTIHDGSALA